jgi:hypothetical protein
MLSPEISEELFFRLNRTELVGKSGSTYEEVRKILKPRWAIVWRSYLRLAGVSPGHPGSEGVEPQGCYLCSNRMLFPMNRSERLMPESMRL